MCQQKIIHPVFLSIVVCICEELPLAGLRWNLKTSANNKMDGWDIVSGIGAMTLPLVVPIYMCYTCYKMPGYHKLPSSDGVDKTYCDELCSEKSEKCGAFCLVIMVVVVIIINILNWADVEAPGAELCI